LEHQKQNDNSNNTSMYMYKYELAVDAGLTNTVLSDRILDLTRNRNRTQQFKLHTQTPHTNSTHWGKWL